MGSNTTCCVHIYVQYSWFQSWFWYVNLSVMMGIDKINMHTMEHADTRGAGLVSMLSVGGVVCRWYYTGLFPWLSLSADQSLYCNLKPRGGAAVWELSFLLMETIFQPKLC